MTQLVSLEADGSLAVSTGAAELTVRPPGDVMMEASGSASVGSGIATLIVEKSRQGIGEHGRFGMTLPYVTLADAQPRASDGRAGARLC